MLVLQKTLPFYGHLIITLDDSNVSKIAKHIHRKKITFGFSSRNQFQIINVELLKGVQNFQLLDTNTKKLYSFSTPLSGKHNIYNLCAAICVALEEKISISDIKKGLKNFKGVGRRFETGKISISNQPKILIDDYGHHPTEILVTIKAIKEKFPKKRILMIFEPHRYSRTKQLLKDFIKVLLKVDQLVLLDIYPASEKPMRGISSSRLMDEINQQKGNAINLSNDHAIEWITKNYKEFDILVTQGAGTISQLNNSIKEKWALKK